MLFSASRDTQGMGDRVRALVDRYRAHRVRYVAMVAGSVSVLIGAGVFYIYLDADKRASERALATLQFCHLALRTADEKRALDEQRSNLSSIHDTAGEIRGLIAKLPPDERAKAHQIIGHMDDAVGKQGRLISEHLQRSEDAAEALRDRTQSIERGVSGLQSGLDGLKPLPVTVHALSDLVAHLDGRAAATEGRLAADDDKLQAIQRSLETLVSRPAPGCPACVCEPARGRRGGRTRRRRVASDATERAVSGRSRAARKVCPPPKPLPQTPEGTGRQARAHRGDQRRQAAAAARPSSSARRHRQAEPGQAVVDGAEVPLEDLRDLGAQVERVAVVGRASSPSRAASAAVVAAPLHQQIAGPHERAPGPLPVVDRSAGAQPLRRTARCAATSTAPAGGAARSPPRSSRRSPAGARPSGRSRARGDPACAPARRWPRPGCRRRAATPPPGAPPASRAATGAARAPAGGGAASAPRPRTTPAAPPSRETDRAGARTGRPRARAPTASRRAPRSSTRSARPAGGGCGSR